MKGLSIKINEILLKIMLLFMLVVLNNIRQRYQLSAVSCQHKQQSLFVQYVSGNAKESDQ